jgi:carbon monoxide dehydrogenase subunit G
MASIQREISIAAPPDRVWDALRDLGAIHTRLARGFVTDVKLEPGARMVTFANGMVIREVIVDVDERTRRVVWSATGGRLTHHNASAQVFAVDDQHTRFVWIADLLPHEMAPGMAEMIDLGMRAIKQTLEQT